MTDYTPCQGWCDAEKDGFTCSLPHRHAGPHIAEGEREDRAWSEEPMSARSNYGISKERACAPVAQVERPQLSLDYVRTLHFNAERDVQRCPLGPHPLDTGYCGKCGWAFALAQMTNQLQLLLADEVAGPQALT